MESQESILATVKTHLLFSGDPDVLIGMDSVLSDLGVTSLHLITIILELQREYKLDINCMTADGMPTTVRDLVAVIQRGSPRVQISNKIDCITPE